MALIVGFGGHFSAGILIEDKNWPPYIPFPILHHDIANDIPEHTQQLQYHAYWSWLGKDLYCIVDLQHFHITTTTLPLTTINAFESNSDPFEVQLTIRSGGYIIQEWEEAWS